MTKYRSKYLMFKIPRVNWNGHEQIAAFELHMTAALSYLTKTGFLQGRDNLARF